MNTKEQLLLLSVIDILLRYGPKAIMAIAEAMKIETVTADDVRALFIDKRPEDFFE